MTPKEIAKRIKAKGLQRLRWYCQMCNKQCRDENGFKCHTLSEGHRRQMGLYLDNPKKYQENFSRVFEADFMQHLSRCYGTNRVKANSVYQDFIKDRHHQHMNSTKWATLTEFVLHLGKLKKVEVEETPKGWYIKYIPRDPEALKRINKEKQEMDEEARSNMILEMQIKNSMRTKGTDNDSQEDNLEEEQKLLDINKISEMNFKFSMGDTKSTNHLDNHTSEKNVVAQEESNVFDIFEDNNENQTKKRDRGDKKDSSQQLDSQKKPKISPLDEILGMGKIKKAKARERERDRNNEKGNKEKVKEKEISAENSNPKNWLISGIFVKILNKDLAKGKYYKKKGIVLKTHDNGYIGDIQIENMEDQIRLGNQKKNNFSQT